jgi:hypothetical protein
MTDFERRNQEVNELSDRIQRLFVGRETSVCIHSMLNLVIAQTIKAASSRTDAEEKLAEVCAAMEREMARYYERHEGRRH